MAQPPAKNEWSFSSALSTVTDTFNKINPFAPDDCDKQKTIRLKQAEDEHKTCKDRKKTIPGTASVAPGSAPASSSWLPSFFGSTAPATPAAQKGGKGKKKTAKKTANTAKKTANNNKSKKNKNLFSFL